MISTIDGIKTKEYQIMDNDLFQANNESSDGLRDSKTSNPETVEPITVSNAPLSPRRKLDWVVAGGVMIFVLIVSILLIPGWLLNDAPADILTATFPRGEEPGVSSLPAQNTTATSSSPSESTSPPANTQQLTGEQQAMLDIFRPVYSSAFEHYWLLQNMQFPFTNVCCHNRKPREVNTFM